MEIPPIKAVMTAFPHLIESGAAVIEAQRMMQEHEIRHLPVIDDGQLVGILTDRDLKLALDPGLGRTEAGALTVGDVCIRDAYVVEALTPLDIVLTEMVRRHIGSALVVRKQRLIGIFTATDACRHYARLLRSLYPRGGGDGAA